MIYKLNIITIIIITISMCGASEERSHGHGQARSEQETVHAVHAEVSWVCRNGALHAGGILVFYFLNIFLAYPLATLLALSASLFIFIIIVASTALLLLPCITQCRRCPQQSGPIVFLVLLTLICGGYYTFR